MLRTVILIASIFCVVQSSGVHHLSAAIGDAPVVTAASSQYFERTFNRLVAAPPLVPLPPATPPVYVHTAQAFPVPQPQPQVFSFQPVQPVQQVPVQSAQPVQPAQPVEPNVAIAVATAHAAPVATILLPPYPFGFPPGYGLIPQEQPSNGDEKTQEPEQTTTATTTQVEVKTTVQEPESTTPLPTTSDNNFDQASSNQNVNFRQYLAPAQPSPQAQPSNQNVNFRQYLAPAPPRPQAQSSNQNVNFRQYLASAQPSPQAQPSNQNVNFRQYLAPAPPRPQAQSSNQNVNFRQYLAPAQPSPQAQPSNQNVNFRQYLAPAFQRPQVQQPLQPTQQQLPYALPQPLPHQYHHDHHPHTHLDPLAHGKPQKLKTSVEIVKAPLAYIAPPPIPQHSHNHEAVKVVKHVHTFVPARAKLIIRPVSHHHTRSVPVRVITYKSPVAIKAAPRVLNIRPENSREAEFTTFRPFSRPNTKPPKL